MPRHFKFLGKISALHSFLVDSKLINCSVVTHRSWKASSHHFFSLPLLARSFETEKCILYLLTSVDNLLSNDPTGHHFVHPAIRGGRGKKAAAQLISFSYICLRFLLIIFLWVVSQVFGGNKKRINLFSGLGCRMNPPRVEDSRWLNLWKIWSVTSSLDLPSAPLSIRQRKLFYNCFTAFEFPCCLFIFVSKQKFPAGTLSGHKYFLSVQINLGWWKRIRMPLQQQRQPLSSLTPDPCQFI